MERKIDEDEFMMLVEKSVSNVVDTTGASPMASIMGMIFGIELKKLLFEDTEEITIVKEGG